jgi:RNA polymerase sigma-70 factor (ECF subfamily)
MLRFKNGDQTAFQELVDRHKLTVLNMCLRFTGNKDDADDLAQEVFIRVCQAAPNYEVKAAFTTWLYRITVNLCLNYQRRKKILQFFSLNHSKAIEDQIEHRAHWLEIHDRPDTALERKELQNLVQGSIQSLPENQKTALILHCYQNLSYQEIADVLKTTVSAVESRLHRAKENLRKRLKWVAKETAYD